MKAVIAHQTFLSRDAIGHDIIEEYDCLKDNSVDVEVYSQDYSDDVSALVNPKAIDSLCNKNAVLIYHHSIYWKHGYDLLKKAKCKIIIKYHNITPSYFFLPYSDNYFKQTMYGQKQTIDIARSNHGFLFADSQFNADDFLQAGFPKEKVRIVPPFTKVKDFDNLETGELEVNSLDRGKVKVLFIGRVVPNKGHKHLIYTAYYYRLLFGANIKFYIIGGLDPSLKAYYKELTGQIDRLNLNEAFAFVGSVSSEKIKAYYQGCDVFLCLSEHEGFCVPILEAQYLNLPVIAYSSSAVKDTIGKNQLVFNSLDYSKLASAIYEVSQDKNISQYLVRQGNKNLQKYNQSNLRKIFMVAWTEVVSS